MHYDKNKVEQFLRWESVRYQQNKINYCCHYGDKYRNVFNVPCGDNNCGQGTSPVTFSAAVHLVDAGRFEYALPYILRP